MDALLKGDKRKAQLLTADQGNDGMSHGLEKEETITCFDFGEHHGASGDQVKEDDDIEGADDVKDHITWTSEGFAEFAHHHCETLVSILRIEKKMVGTSQYLYTVMNGTTERFPVDVEID
jgi:hypothetical protein